jgi:hypothetical protein
MGFASDWCLAILYGSFSRLSSCPIPYVGGFFFSEGGGVGVVLSLGATLLNRKGDGNAFGYQLGR